jgi:hypothetical protein
VGHASRSSGLLRVEASLVRVSQSGLKTGGGATTGGARGMLCRRQVEDRRVDAMVYVGPCYLTFAVFNVLGHKDIVVI